MHIPFFHLADHAANNTQGSICLWKKCLQHHMNTPSIQQMEVRKVGMGFGMGWRGRRRRKKGEGVFANICKNSCFRISPLILTSCKKLCRPRHLPSDCKWHSKLTWKAFLVYKVMAKQVHFSSLRVVMIRMHSKKLILLIGVEKLFGKLKYYSPISVGTDWLRFLKDNYKTQ